METKNENTSYTKTETRFDFGLTKRELFAAMAMQGLCADRSFTGFIAESSVKLADELIKELNKCDLK